jgi:AcrR family transcriptional regulator
MSANTKDLILNSAMELFSTIGYNKASMRDIARNADISTGPLYFYFKNKAELFTKILYNAYEKINSVYTDINVENGDYLGALKNFFKKYIEVYYSEFYYFRTIEVFSKSEGDFLVPDDLKLFINKSRSMWSEKLENILIEGIVFEQIKSVNVKALSVFIQSIINAVIERNNSELAQEGPDIDTMVDEAIKLIKQ